MDLYSQDGNILNIRIFDRNCQRAHFQICNFSLFLAGNTKSAQIERRFDRGSLVGQFIFHSRLTLCPCIKMSQYMSTVPSSFISKENLVCGRKKVISLKLCRIQTTWPRFIKFWQRKRQSVINWSSMASLWKSLT